MKPFIPAFKAERKMDSMDPNDDDLLKFDIPEIIYGMGAISRIGQCAERLGGERVFLVTDPGIVAAGWVDRCIRHLTGGCGRQPVEGSRGAGDQPQNPL